MAPDEKIVEYYKKTKNLQKTETQRAHTGAVLRLRSGCFEAEPVIYPPTKGGGFLVSE